MLRFCCGERLRLVSDINTFYTLMGRCQYEIFFIFILTSGDCRNNINMNLYSFIGRKGKSCDQKEEVADNFPKSQRRWRVMKSLSKLAVVLVTIALLAVAIIGVGAQDESKTTNVRPEKGGTEMNIVFFEKSAYAFESLRALGAVSFGGGEVGEVLTALEQIKEGDDEGWYASW